jgi:hypothetical protein
MALAGGALLLGYFGKLLHLLHLVGQLDFLSGG